MDKKFIMNIQGKEFVKFEGLLAEFHSNGGKKIDTIELETSTSEEPKFKAIVSGEKGEFSGHGDANTSNVNTMIAKHKYRMAETRAIARALRWYNNIGMCSVDELGEGNNKEEKKEVSKPKILKTNLDKLKDAIKAKKITTVKTAMSYIFGVQGDVFDKFEDISEEQAKDLLTKIK